MKRAVLLALAVWACWAPAASAARVYAHDDSLVVWDAVGEPNDIQLSTAADGRLTIVDSAPVTVAEGCEAVDAHTAACPAPSQGMTVGLGLDEDDLHPNRLVVGVGVTVFVSGSNAADHVVGGDGVEYVSGYGGADRIEGGGGADWLDGGNGDDLLTGGDAADQLHGGNHDDDLDGGAGYDVLQGGPGTDRALYADHPAGVRLSMSTQSHDGVKAITDSIDGIDTVVGSPHADVIEGSSGPDQLIGGGGDDRISGMGGADLIDGGDGDDALLGDSPRVEAPSEFPAAGGGDDRILGGSGADVLRGDAGRDHLDGEAGADRVDAREDASTHEGRDEVVACGDGVDTALLDWNDEPHGCEDVQARPRPEYPRSTAPPMPGPLLPGPGPQPVLGAPSLVGGAVAVPVHCAAARACAVRVRLRDARAVRRGGRRRAAVGGVLATARARIAAGTTQPVAVALPPGMRARMRRGRVRLVVELRIGTRRWLRPLTLGS